MSMFFGFSSDGLKKYPADASKMLFEDLFRMKPDALEHLLRHIDDDTIANAIHPLGQPFKDYILESLHAKRSESIKDILKETKAKIFEIKRSRLVIENIIRKLEQCGELKEDSFVSENESTYEPEAFEHEIDWDNASTTEIIDFFMLLNEYVRKNGILGLEDYAKEVDHPIVGLGLKYITSGMDPELVEDVLVHRSIALGVKDDIKTNLIVYGMQYFPYCSPSLLNEILTAYMV